MPRTVTHPPNDPKMWRLLTAHAHPDSGGDHDLFVWTVSVKDAVCAGPEPRPYEAPRHNTPAPADAAERVPFSPFEDFDGLSEKIRSVAAEVPETYARLLRLLIDCHAVDEGPLYYQQTRGATYKQLAALAYKAGMSKAERVRWYRLAESIPLSQRHAGHIIGTLQKKRAA